MSNQYVNTVGEYVCPYCQQSVPANENHVCFASAVQPQIEFSWPVVTIDAPPSPFEEKQIAALERIAAALETIAGTREPRITYVPKEDLMEGGFSRTRMRESLLEELRESGDPYNYFYGLTKIMYDVEDNYLEDLVCEVANRNPD